MSENSGDGQRLTRRRVGIGCSRWTGTSTWRGILIAIAGGRVSAGGQQSHQQQHDDGSHLSELTQVL